jgi:chemosensory pili system protein ChpC
MNEPLPREIRCVLISAGGLRLLLPNATVAEVIALPAPAPAENGPDWLLGRIDWRGWSVPLLSYARLAGGGSEELGAGARVAVLKALGGNPQLPFIAVVTQGFPRLLTLNAELIIPTHDGNPLPPGVSAQVLVRDDVAAIPDLEGLERELLALAAPAA